MATVSPRIHDVGLLAITLLIARPYSTDQQMSPCRRKDLFLDGTVL